MKQNQKQMDTVLSELVLSKNQSQNQTQQIQRKILDNMLPETFQLKFPTIRKRKFQQNGQQQQNLKNKKSKTQQKQSNKKTKQIIYFRRVRQSTHGPTIEYTDPQTGEIILKTISEEELKLKIEAGGYKQI